MRIAIHINPSLAHQIAHGEWFKQGFLKHGIRAEVTSSVTQSADVHIVSGPWYAKAHWLNHPRVILLDRCFYKGDPDHVSLGWMNPNGSRSFNAGSGRDSVTTKDLPATGGTIFLQDYKGPIGHADTIRRHPSEARGQPPLIDVLRQHRSATGYKTTALVTAALEGLEVKSFDPDHILNQTNWPELLPWADWHYTEIQSGEAWEHLKSSQPPLLSQ